MATRVYGPGLLKMMDGSIDVTAASDVHCALMKESFATEIDVDDDLLADIGMGTYEQAGGTYVRKTLANVSISYDATNNQIEIDADDVTWTALTVTAGKVHGVLVYFCAGATGAGTEGEDTALAYPLCYIDTYTGATPLPYEPSGQNFTIQWGTDGVFKVPLIST